MNVSQQPETQKTEVRAPLFASMWVALFFVLRHEFTQARARAK